MLVRQDIGNLFEDHSGRWRVFVGWFQTVVNVPTSVHFVRLAGSGRYGWTVEATDGAVGRSAEWRSEPTYDSPSAAMDRAAAELLEEDAGFLGARTMQEIAEEVRAMVARIRGREEAPPEASRG